MVRKSKTGLTQKDIFVSLVAVAGATDLKLAPWIENATSILKSHYTNYEVIIVDNRANQEIKEDMATVLKSIACVRVLRLARPATYDYAIFAGLDSAIGDYVCTFDPMFDSLEEIPKIVEVNERFAAVQGVSDAPHSAGAISKLGRNTYYSYTKKYLGIDIPVNATNLASYNRTAVNALTRTGRSHKHVRHLVRLLGFRPEQYVYRPKISLSKNHNLRTGLIEGLEIAASYSAHPLRFVTWVGVVASTFNIVYATYVVLQNIFRPTELAAGWTTTSLQSSVMFFVLFVIMVILAEYVGRILVETRGDTYFVVDEQSSQVSLADENRTNVENR